MLVCPPNVCLCLHVTASSFASMSTHCVSLSAHYCKQLYQYVDPLCVSISTLLQAAVPLCRPTMCLSFLVTASSFSNISTHCVSLSALYIKQLCHYFDPLFVSISTLLQAAVPVCRPPLFLYLHVTASSFASLSTHCMFLSARYFKQLCQYVDQLFVSISTLLQAAVPVCRPTFCLYLHVTAISCASMSTHCVSLSPHCLCTVMCHLTKGILSEECVVRRYLCCAIIIKCTYTNAHITV